MDLDLTEKGLHNGQLVLVLSSGNCEWSRGFNMDWLVRRLKGLGFQMFYVAAWGNIYSTFRQLSVNLITFCLCVSLSAASFTVIIILLLDRQARKINVNTDVRLAAVNETLMKHNLLAGITETTHWFSNMVHLSLIYFKPQQCSEGLLALLEQRKNDDFFQAELRKQLDDLCIVVERTVPLQEEEQSKLPEERPLISSRSSDSNSAVTWSGIISLISPGTPVEMTHRLLVMYSAVYVRLLVTGQLPSSSPSPHASHITAPCLCRFIQTVLNLRAHSEEAGAPNTNREET
ncbi:transmembrane protein 268 isoform X2 [Callorhinchus milii]|uniref:transmembrane protein 268 isoform X2 n=1 Tax=Callorhinchus milii TaxID=7868 RepID=UPI001C3FD209|nr:transmembrane protein 268 isoform X2 [Callorhinchus milii]